MPRTSDAEHAVTPLELFFDLVFVFALTQVTSLIAHDPTWRGLGHGLLVLAAVWWAWSGYTWLGSALDVDDGGVRLSILAAMAAMLVVALAVPRAFGDDAVVFGVGYLAVRLVHIVLYAVVSRDDPEALRAVRRAAAPELSAAALLVAAGFADGARMWLWLLALALAYAGHPILGLRGWRIAAQHFAERHGLIVLIALGESVVSIGVGAGPHLGAGALVAAGLGFVVIAALWWLYFDVAAIIARRRLVEKTGVDQPRLALMAYSYLHLPMVSGVVLFAFALKTTVAAPDQALGWVPVVALCAGTSLYLVGQVAFLFSATRYVFRRRTAGAVVLLALLPAAHAVPALAAVALVGVVCAAVVAYEAIRHREPRAQLRHGDGGATG